MINKYNDIDSNILKEDLTRDINLDEVEINETITKYIIIFIFSNSLLFNQFIEFLLEQKNDNNGSAGDIENFLKSIARLSPKFKNLITNLLIKKILENPKNKLLLDKMKKLLEDLGVDVNNLNLGEFIEKIGIKDNKNINKNSLLSNGKINVKDTNKKIKKLKSLKKSLVKSGIINTLLSNLSKRIIKEKNVIRNKEGDTININGKVLKNSDIEKVRKKLDEIDNTNKNSKNKQCNLHSENTLKLKTIGKNALLTEKEFLDGVGKNLDLRKGFGKIKEFANNLINSIKKSNILNSKLSSPSTGSSRTTSSVSFSGRGSSGGLSVGGKIGDSRESVGSRKNKEDGEIKADGGIKSGENKGTEFDGRRDMNGDLPKNNSLGYTNENINTRQENKEEQVKNEQNEKLTRGDGISSGITEPITKKQPEPVENSVGNGQISGLDHNKELPGLAAIATEDMKKPTKRNESEVLNNIESKNGETTPKDLHEGDNKAFKSNDDIIDPFADDNEAYLVDEKQKTKSNNDPFTDDNEAYLDNKEIGVSQGIGGI